VENIPGALIVGESKEEIINKSDKIINRMKNFYKMPL